MPEAKGPLDITPALAQSFKERYISGTFTRGKGEAAKRYERSHVTLNSLLRKLQSLWSKWFAKTFHFVKDNPWKTVAAAPVDKERPPAPAEATVADFVLWLSDHKYPGWRLPAVFIKVKAALGCRLMDLCSLHPDQFDGAAIHFDAEQVKTREDQTVPLPAPLAAELASVTGERFLWDRYSAELLAHLRARKLPHGTVSRAFDVKTFFWFVCQLFKAETGRALRSHDLRKRAVTLLVEAGYTDDQVAAQVGMTVQNLRASYLDGRRIRPKAELAALLDLTPPSASVSNKTT